jgi:hypothetical protein
MLIIILVILLVLAIGGGSWAVHVMAAGAGLLRSSS